MPPLHCALPLRAIRLLVNEQRIVEEVGSRTPHGADGVGSGQRRGVRGGGAVWVKLERRSSLHLLLCADLVRFYRHEATDNFSVARSGGGGDRHDRKVSRDIDGEAGGEDDGMSNIAGASGGSASGKKKKRALSEEESRGSGQSHLRGAASGIGDGKGCGGARKRSRATDPWEDILGALHAQVSVPRGLSGGQGRQPSVPRDVSSSM